MWSHVVHRPFFRCQAVKKLQEKEERLAKKGKKLSAEELKQKNEAVKARLQELGPRFTLKLR